MENFSKRFSYLPSNTVRNEKINQFMKSVSLHPIICIYETFKQYSSCGNEFIPQYLDSTDQQKRAFATEIVLNFLKEAVDVSNANLVQNANYLMTTLSKPSKDFVWVGVSKKRFDSTKFNLTG